jgi:hypothetical protein
MSGTVNSTVFAMSFASPNFIGIPAIEEIVYPNGDIRADILPRRPYAVVRAAPMFIYKRWATDGRR